MVVRTYWQGYGWPWRGEGCITRLVETRSGEERKGRAEQEAAVGFGTVGATRTTAKARGEKREARLRRDRPTRLGVCACLPESHSTRHYHVHRVDASWRVQSDEILR